MHATNGRAKLGVGRVPGGASMDAVSGPDRDCFLYINSLALLAVPSPAQKRKERKNTQTRVGAQRSPIYLDMELRLRVPQVYLAPELLSEDASDGPMSAADMYALGMFLWEVFAEDRPVQPKPFSRLGLCGAHS